MIFGRRKNRELREENAELRRIIGDFAKDFKVAKGEVEKWKSLNLDLVERAHMAEDALRAIAAQETPGANATVKRMAKIAREALGEETE